MILRVDKSTQARRTAPHHNDRRPRHLLFRQVLEGVVSGKAVCWKYIGHQEQNITRDSFRSLDDDVSLSSSIFGTGLPSTAAVRGAL